MTDFNRIDKLADILLNLGYRAQKVEDKFIRTGFGGIVVGAFAYENDTVQLTCSFDTEGGPDLSAEYANKFNSKYRYAKAYIDVDGDLIVCGDFIVPLAEGYAPFLIEKALSLFEGSLSLLREMAVDDDDGEPDSVSNGD